MLNLYTTLWRIEDLKIQQILMSIHQLTKVVIDLRNNSNECVNRASYCVKLSLYLPSFTDITVAWKKINLYLWFLLAW